MRTVDFKPGRLNIVTGLSTTGKSALLDIVDFCLGRDDAPIPGTLPFQSIDWYGTLWQLPDGSKAFLGRPRIKPGKNSTSRAMVNLGGKDLGVPAHPELVPNTDSEALRNLIGAKLGFKDAKLSPPEGSTRSDFKVGLGQAAIFLFQTQSEIANRSLLFHRQGETGMPGSIRESLPFFLGAVSGDHADKHQKLRAARRQLRRAEVDFEEAELEATEQDTQIQALLSEAYTAGLTEIAKTASAIDTVDVLQEILRSPTPTDVGLSIEGQDRQRELRTELLTHRSELGRLLDMRESLVASAAELGTYESAIGLQQQRLRSVGLLPDSPNAESAICPVCGGELHSADPTPAQLTNRLTQLSTELELMVSAMPGQGQALNELNEKIRNVSERLSSVELAVQSIEIESNQGRRTPNSSRQQFVRGRIDAILNRFSRGNRADLSSFKERVAFYRANVEALEHELDDNIARERLTSALISLGRYMTAIAQDLDLENSDDAVRLELAKLTVVTDSQSGPVPLSSLGSGANWLGYHLATHLALHDAFVAQDMPVPRILMLDQPTQVFYESNSSADDSREDVTRPANEDHESVKRMFTVLHKFVERLAPDFQIIVSDHVDLKNEQWFQDSIVHNWRGEALIPRDWFEDT